MIRSASRARSSSDWAAHGAQSMIASRRAIATAWRAAVGFQLGQDVPHMALDGLLADEQLGSRVRIRHPVGEQLQDLPLAAGEHVRLVLAGDEGRHQRRVDEALAGGDLLDRAEERGVRRLLEDVARAPDSRPRPRRRALAVGGEDQHRGVGHALAQELRRLEPVHPGHADVHDHDVGPAPLGERDRAGAVGRLADHADVGSPRERQAEALAHDFVVVCDEAGDLVRHGMRI